LLVAAGQAEELERDVTRPLSGRVGPVAVAQVLVAGFGVGVLAGVAEGVARGARAAGPISIATYAARQEVGLPKKANDSSQAAVRFRSQIGCRLASPAQRRDELSR
jgi:hypothetical protein